MVRENPVDFPEPWAAGLLTEAMMTDTPGLLCGYHTQAREAPAGAASPSESAKLLMALLSKVLLRYF